MTQWHNAACPAVHDSKHPRILALALMVAAFVGLGGFALAQDGRDHGKSGPTVKVLSSVDVSEMNGLPPSIS